MVECFDAIADKAISISLDKKLIKIWDGIKDGKLEQKQEDRVYLVDGREGSGKSFFAIQQAKYINPEFSVDDIYFKADDFVNAIRTAKPGKVIIFDEAFKGLSSKGSNSKINKEIVQALMEVRQRSLIIFIVLPTLFLLEIYAACFRSEALFHIYKMKKVSNSTVVPRAFKIYNYKKKMQLYLRGKSKFFSYSFPKIRMAKGRFYVKTLEKSIKTPYETFELDAYRHRKDAAFANISGENGVKEADKYQEPYYNMIRIVVNLTGSQGKAAKLMSEYGNPMSQQGISKLFAEKGWKTGETPLPTTHKIDYNNVSITKEEGHDAQKKETNLQI